MSKSSGSGSISSEPLSSSLSSLGINLFVDEEVRGIKGEYPGPDSPECCLDGCKHRRRRSEAERRSLRNSEMVTRPEEENAYLPPVWADFIRIPIPTCCHCSSQPWSSNRIIAQSKHTIATRHSADRYPALWRPICHDFGSRRTPIFAGELHAVNNWRWKGSEKAKGVFLMRYTRNELSVPFQVWDKPWRGNASLNSSTWLFHPTCRSGIPRFLVEVVWWKLITHN